MFLQKRFTKGSFVSQDSFFAYLFAPSDAAIGEQEATRKHKGANTSFCPPPPIMCRGRADECKNNNNNTVMSVLSPYPTLLHGSRVGNNGSKEETHKVTSSIFLPPPHVKNRKIVPALCVASIINHYKF